MQGAVGFQVYIWLQIYKETFQWIFFKSVKIWQKYGHKSVAPHFWPTL